jgi:hypothetical protein
MTMTQQRHNRGVGADDTPTVSLPVITSGARKPALLDQMGGPMGFVYSTIPVVVFVTANGFCACR